MKSKITILLVTLFVLAFSAQAVAQTKDVALIYGAETQTTIVTDPVWAETILVQFNSELVDPTFSWSPAEWALVLGDFKILDGATLVPVTAAEVSAVGTNYISLTFNSSVYHFGPDKNDLKLNYVNYSGIAITTDYGNLQNTSTAVNIDDGINPILYTYSIQSNNSENTYLGEAGNVVTFNFEADEALAITPDAPIVTFTVPELRQTFVVDAETADPLKKEWTASFTIPDPGSNLDGRVSVSATFWDVHANSGSLSPAVDVGTDDTYVIVKNYDPATVYVNETWASQADVDPPTLIWFWDAFAVIQDGIDGVAAAGIVNVYDGTYYENVTIAKALTLQSYDGGGKPAVSPVIDGGGTGIVVTITANNVTFQGFTVQNSGTTAADGGIYLSSVTGCTIQTNIVTNNANGIVAAYGAGNSIKSNTVNDIDWYGIALAGSVGNTIELNTISGIGLDAIALDNAYEVGGSVDTGSTGNFIKTNTISNITRDGIFLGLNCESNAITDINNISNVTVNGIHIWNTDEQTITDNVITSAAVGIRLRGASNNTITGNTVTGNGIGVLALREWTDPTSYPSENNTIHSNDFSGNTVGMNADDNWNTAGELVLVTAENNWWGSTNGPTHADNTFNVTAQGDASSDNVDYVPWYDTDMSGTSFAPIESDDGLKAITYFSSFQTAIDAAAGGETISCVAGTYTENVNVNKSVTLVGASSATVNVIPAVAGTSVFNVTANSVSMSEFTVSGASGGGQAGIYLGAGVSLCNIFDNILTGNFDGIWLGAGSNLNTLTSNTLTANYQGFEVYIAYDNTFTSNIANSNTNYGFKIDSGDNNQFTSNIANSNTKFGFYVVTGDGGGCSNTTFTNNTANLNTTYGIRINGGSGTTLTGNTFDSNGVSGIRFKETMTTVTMTGNTITNNPIGIEITDSVDDVSTWAVNYNHIVGNTNYGISNAAVAGTLDAEENWWGSANGPTHAGNTFNVTAQGDNSSDNVDYVPWYNTDMTGSSFAPVDLISGITKISTTEYFSSVQAAIDAASGGDEIFCYSGTFTEDFVVDKALDLTGEELVKQDVVLLGEQEVTSGGVYFSYFEFDPGGAGTALLFNSSAAAIDDIEVYGCTFTLTTSPSVGIYLGGGGSPNKVSDINIEGNVFNGPDDKICNPWKVGGSYGNNVSCEIEDMSFYNNEVNKGSIPINLVDANITNIWIYYNDFYDTDGIIYFWNSPASSPVGVLSNFVFENNYVPSTNSYGVAIGDEPSATITDINFGTGNRINDNFFECGTTYGYGAVFMAENYTNLLDASNNWWGDVYGPENDNNTYTPPAPLKGRATVSDRVEFAPWWNDGTNAATGRGWEPDAGSSLYAPVHNVTQDTYHSSIQRGVDGATASDVIECLAGTFAEGVTIDESVILKGANYDVSPNTGTRGTETIIEVPGTTSNIMVTASDVIVNGFTVQAHPTGFAPAGGTMFGITGDDATVKNNIFNTTTFPNTAVGISALWSNMATGMDINDNKFLTDGGAQGGLADGAADLYGGGLTTNHNLFHDNVLVHDNIGGGYGLAISSDAGLASYYDVEDNSFSTYNSAIQVVDYTTAADHGVNNVLIDGNTCTSGKYGIWFYGIAGDVGTGISDVTVTYNYLTNNVDGIHFQSGATNIDIASFVVNYNHITGNSTYGINNPIATSLDATKNWWGDATGPVNASNPHSPKGYGDGDNVSDNVTFIPWYATSTVTTTTEYVITHLAPPKGSPKPSLSALAYADAIQPCIDAAAGMYYYVQVTDKSVKESSIPYTENLIVDNQAYIYGETLLKVSAPVTIIGTHVITGDNVTFDYFTLTPGTGVPGTVITINSASQIIDGTTVTDCQFDIDTSPSVGVYVGGATPTNAVNNTTIEYNTFNGPTDMISNPFKVGGQFGSPVGCEIGGLAFEYNYVNYGSIPINIADKDVDLSLSYNDFTDTDGVIYFWGEDVVKSPTGEITEFQFNNNYVGSTNSYGVGFDVFGNFTSANYGGDIHIYNNYFDAAIPGAYGFDAVSTLTPTADLAGYILDAEDNWWGTEDGPTHSSNTFNVPSQGVEVSDNVDFVQWYDSGDGYDDPGWVPTGSLFAPVVVGTGKAANPYDGDLFAPVIVGSGKGIDPYYASIQAGVNGASSGDDIICYGAPSNDIGTFYEDFSVPATITGLDIYPYGADKDYDDVTIKGQATVAAGLWPLADPNIEILGADAGIWYFTIEAPVYVEGYYSSGIVIGATNVDIGYNTFINNTVNTTGDISQAIQTYLGMDCSALEIGYNTFTDNLAKGSWGYEAIYINPGIGKVPSETSIFYNDFEGMCLRAITIEDADHVGIYNNTIETTMIPLVDWNTSGAYQGINLQGDLSDITISGNYIGGLDSKTTSYGFAQGIRLGSDGDTFTNVLIGDASKNGPTENTIKYNSIGILCKSAAGVVINYNIIEDNVIGVQNDDTGAKAILDATYNYWGATDGPSFTFDYGIGSGSGDEVSEYVDFYPWYQDDALTTQYVMVMDQFLLSINPASPYVDNYFDLRVCAADAAGIRDFSYGNLADFSSSHVALSVPEEQLLVQGFKEVTGACISVLPFDAADHLTIFAWEYDTNPPDYYSNLTDIVVQELNNPAPPTGVVFTDNPGDNGGWILVDYTLSIDDPFYTAVKDPSYGVSYYVVEIDTAVASGVPDWHYLATIACYDNGSVSNDYTALLPAPASDTAYNFRMASVYNPTKLGGFDENHISYNEIVTKDAGAQSTWQTGSAAPKDNLPAYANMKVFLQGPYSNGAMTDGAQKPLVSPYDGEIITALPLPNNQIIDWIYVELRLAATGETVKEANGFLLKNGTIVDVNGNNSLPFYYTTDVEYYLVIHHSNHIDIMSALTHTFGDFASQTTTINLTGATAAYGGGFASLGSGNYGLYGGDVNDNNSVTIGDAIEIYNHRGQTGYLIWDFNMNGSVTIGDAISCYNNRGKATTVPNQTAKDGGHPLDVEITAPVSKDDNTVDLQISNPRLEGGMFKMEVQLRRTSAWPFIIPGIGYDNLLKDADLQFDYNPAGFTGAPAYTNLNAGLDTAEYSTTISVAANALTLSITGPETSTTTMYSPALNVWETICTIELTIADIHENSGVVWNESGTGLISAAGVGGGFLVDTYYGSGDITLPVELSEFKAMFSSANENIELRWDTASENDVNGFNIYRSDVKDLTRAGRHINYSLVPAAGTTTEPQSYVYSDVVADVYATHYYWLEVVDFGGTSSFHGPYAYTPGDIDGDSTPDLIASTELLGNFPNPAVNSTKIKYQIKGTVIDQNATISVYNVRGELVTTLQGRNGVATLDTSNMGHGIYFYRLQTNDYSDIKKLIVVK